MAKPIGYTDVYPRDYFEESIEAFKEDCSSHGEMGFEYKDKTYAVDNTDYRYTISECGEDFLNKWNSVKELYSAETIDELFDFPYYDGKSINEIYDDIKTFN